MYSKKKDEVWQKFQSVIYQFGVPEIVHCDNGGEFQWYLFSPYSASFLLRILQSLLIYLASKITKKDFSTRQRIASRGIHEFKGK